MTLDRHEGCGHIILNGLDSCEKCMKSREFIDNNTPLGWLSKVLPQNRFTILIFYRGKWCSGCQTYLQQTDPIVSEIRNSGGDIYAICAQSQKEVEITQKDWKLHYQLVADPKNVIAKKYNMGVMNQKGKKFSKFFEVLSEYLNKTPEIPKMEDGIAMPALLVFKQDGSILYSWKSKPLENNLFGGLNRINPADVLKIVQFYFSNESVVDSVKQYVRKNSYDTFLQILNDKEGLKLFNNHLKKEFNSESLEFILDVDQLRSHQDGADDIFASYIPGGANKELNLPGTIRKLVTSEFNAGSKIGAFNPAYEHVKFSLSEDSFNRFVNTEDFIRIAGRIIPQCFTSEPVDDVCFIK
ncbi:regulator of G-protein signaling [Acrasis kona]|uniref:Regulator of G-protein signaling n=1 Tax=Acrasis kona TaxID=1008807 RepID=A0AAW2ZJP1_9EUKA